MTKVNFRIVVTSEVKEGEGRKEKRARLVGLFFSVKSFLRKKKTKANIAKISICQIWIEVYRYLSYFLRFSVFLSSFIIFLKKLRLSTDVKIDI